MAVSRRQFLLLAAAAGATNAVGCTLKAAYNQGNTGVGYGELVSDANKLLDLPPGFQYRAFSVTGELMNDGRRVPGKHDGMAAFSGLDNTVILVRNHEINGIPQGVPGAIAPPDKHYDPYHQGGTTTLVVGSDRQLISHYTSLAGTERNCAGGATPWGSWISCEEPEVRELEPIKHGYNFEVPANATGIVEPIPLVAMGRFRHEAIAVDPGTGIVYQTEDRGDGLFYRFIPNRPGDLRAGGVLQALKIKGRPGFDTSNRDMTNILVGEAIAVEWVTIEEPDPDGDTVRVEGFSKGAARFSRGEGICYSNGEFYFTCTDGGRGGYGQVWRYVPGKDETAGGSIELFVEPGDRNKLDAPDNIIMSPTGDLFICEDGYKTQYIVGINSQGELYRFARNALNFSEFCGVCFSPDGGTMFANIQTPGITLAIWGPWS